MQIAKIILIIVFILVIILIAVFVLINNYQKQQILKSGKVCINNNCFVVELAENNYQRNRGLMFRENLDADKGMLFIFNKEANYPFWMKNTLIPLDMVWIDSNGKIVYIADSVNPCKTFLCPQINPNTNAKYVLEINGGLATKLGIKIGDLVEIVK